MLILNNGVPKSGSTWMQQILCLYLDPLFPSKEWANDWPEPSVDPDRLLEYYKSDEWRKGKTLLKTHIQCEPAFEFLLSDDIRVVVTYRNLADSVVSFFYHELRMGNVQYDEKLSWLETKGKLFCVYAARHRLSWQGKSNTLLVKFESMVENSTPLVQQVAGFLGTTCSEDQASGIVKRTQLKILHKHDIREGQHIRTGGLSVIHDELPERYMAEIEAFQDHVGSGEIGENVVTAFINGGLGCTKVA